MNAIEIKDLCKSYPGFCLDHLNLTLPQGYIMGLIGENGAGKSTTIKLLLNMIQKDSGSISILGKDNQDNFRLTIEDIGVVPDEIGISQCLTPIQVGKIMNHTFRNWDNNAYMDYLRRFSVPEKKKFKDFSRGMKMKLGIAIALSHHPKLLILDEATSGLDPVVRDEILDIFCDFTRDEHHAILISSHIVSDLEKICDYIAFLHKGKLLICEEKDKLKEEYGIIHCSAEQLEELDPAAIQGKKQTAYGVEAIVKRNEIPAGMEIRPIDIEQLFIFMVKEAGIR
ncbi:MAG: ABC transporter ATP-binding protein [Clostridiales bacterium]|nr:ABC transporter ATP-binding protein [Clostridiales bacterium]